jgi:hypothetical protein
MQPTPLATEDGSDEIELLTAVEQPRGRPSRRVLIAGVLSLALVAGAVVKQCSQTPSPARSIGFDGVIQRAAEPECEDPYKACKDLRT